jgi:hypothetical protein
VAPTLLPAASCPNPVTGARRSCRDRSRRHRRTPHAVSYAFSPLPSNFQHASSVFPLTGAAGSLLCRLRPPEPPLKSGHHCFSTTMPPCCRPNCMASSATHLVARRVHLSSLVLTPSTSSAGRPPVSCTSHTTTHVWCAVTAAGVPMWCHYLGLAGRFSPLGWAGVTRQWAK